ncbi:MAG: indole-3-glycerol phosphate synthase TrpC [Planctomycetota bacterium]
MADQRDILTRILDHKRGEVDAAKAARPIEELKAAVTDTDRPRNFFAALTHDPAERGKIMNLIAEVKSASPSAGIIREDYDPATIASAYAAGGADAISVLTDEKFFGGSLDHLKAVRATVELPVLRKDFVVDAYQVWEARAAGADAILLIAEALQTHELIDLQILATELNMTCLIEVHSMENLMRVRDTVIGFPHKSYSLIGINNRNLATFDVSIGNTLRMAELVEDRSVLVTESGIKAREDVAKLASVGVRSALVGETLMRSGDPAAMIDKLFGE